MPILNQLSFAIGRYEDRMMIEVRSPLELKSDPEGGRQLMFWVLGAMSTPQLSTLTGENELTLRDAADRIQPHITFSHNQLWVHDLAQPLEPLLALPAPAA